MAASWSGWLSEPLVQLFEVVPRLSRITARFAMLFAVSFVCTQASGGLSQVALPDDKVVRIQLAHGISVEIPDTWTCLGSAAKSSISAAAYKRLSDSSLPAERLGPLSFAASLIDASGLVVANVNFRQYPQPVGDFGEVREQSELLRMSESDLGALEDTYRQSVELALPAVGGMKPDWGGLDLVQADGHHALLVEYLRPSASGAGKFLVRLLRVPLADRTFTLTVSCLAEPTEAFRSVTDRILESVLISPEVGGTSEPEFSQSVSPGSRKTTEELLSEFTPAFGVALVVFVLMCAGSVGGVSARALLGASPKDRGDRRFPQALIAVLLIVTLILTPIAVWNMVADEWLSPRSSGWFVSVTDAKSGMLVEDLRPPLSESEFISAWYYSIEDLDWEIRDSLVRINGEHSSRPSASYSNDRWAGSDLFTGSVDPIAAVAAEMAVEHVDWRRRVSRSHMNLLAEEVELRDLSYADLLRKVGAVTSLSDSAIRENLNDAIRIAKLIEMKQRRILPMRDGGVWDRLHYLAWDEWYQRDVSLRWATVSLLLVGATLLAFACGWFVVR
jgi:hypothetical protein